MELHQLRYFVAVADTGGFCKAAALCKIAQPSLSQQVRRLEQTIGARLFDRLARGTTLTDAGRELLPRARRILAEVREAQERLAGPSRVQRIAIGAIPTIAPHVLPGVLASVCREHPACEVVVREDYTERILEAVVSAELDVALVATFPDHAALVGEPLGDDPFLLAAPKGHAFASRESVALRDLDDQPFVVLHEVHCLGRQVGELCRSRRVRPTVVSAIAQLPTALSLVEAGLGVTIIPRLCAGAARGRRVALVPILGRGASREIVAVWRRASARPAPAVGLERAVRAVLASS
jgi:LysR family hydrogen peroxide-inducible transcriptional activator